MGNEAHPRSRHAGNDGDEKDFGAVVGNYVDRLTEGEPIDPQEVLERHGDLGPAILEDLRAFIDFSGSPDSAPPALRALGDYTLRRQIGRGGMGVVYEAWQGSMDRVVALKVLPVGIAAETKACMRFIREAKTAGQLNHQNVVAVYSTGVEEGTPWYSMEYVEGETLAQVLARLKNAKPESETPFGSRDDNAYYGNIAKAFADVADGLQHAHSKGVVHRDIKPSNLILDGNGRLRILDFGLARLEGQESLTLTGDFVGTPAYMSPEQAKRRKIPVDHRTDIYSLGATIYELLTHQQPFRGKSHHDTLLQIIERDPTKLRQLDPRIPQAFEMIVLKCLRKEATDRYGTAEAVGQDLQRFVRGDPVEAKAESVVARCLRRFRHQRWKFVAGILGALLVVVTITTVLRHAAIGRQQLRAVYEKNLRGTLMKTYRARAFVSNEEFYVHLKNGEKRIKRFGATTLDLGRRVLEEALLEFEELRTRFPAEPEAYYFSAKAQTQLLRYEQAREQLREGKERFPDFYPFGLLAEELGSGPALVPGPANSWAPVWRDAHEASLEGHWALAVAAYDELLTSVETAEEPYVGAQLEWQLERGMTRLESGDYLRAIIDFAAWLQDCDNCLEATLFLAKAFYLGGDTVRAAQLLEILYDGTPEDERAEVAEVIGGLYAGLGDPDARKKWLELGDPERSGRMRLYRLSREFRYRECAEAARAQLEKTSGKFPTWAFLVSSLLWMTDGRAGAVRDRELDEALQDAKKAATLLPRYSEFPAMQAWAYLQRGDLDVALETAKAACRLAEDEGATGNIALRVLSLVHLERDDLEEAKEAILAAKEGKGAPLLSLPVILERLGNIQEAEALLRTEIVDAPTDARWHARLAELLLREGRFEEAIEACGEAGNLLPENTSLAETHGAALLADDQPEAARRVVEAGIAVIEDRPRLHHVRGLILEELGDVAAARRAFQHAVDLAGRGKYPEWEARIAALDAARPR